MRKLDPPGPTVSFEEYVRLLEDRPNKFTPDQVGYQPRGGKHHNCGRCAHFFSSIERTVCEIMRIGGDESYKDVERDGYCVFFNSDRQEYPRLD